MASVSAGDWAVSVAGTSTAAGAEEEAVVGLLSGDVVLGLWLSLKERKMHELVNRNHKRGKTANDTHSGFK